MDFLNDVKKFYSQNSISKKNRNGIFKNKLRPKFNSYDLVLKNDEPAEYYDYVDLNGIAESISKFQLVLKTDISPYRLFKSELLFNARFVLKHSLFNEDGDYCATTGIDFDLNNPLLFEFTESIIKHRTYFLFVRNNPFPRSNTDTRLKVKITTTDEIHSLLKELSRFYCYWKDNKKSLYNEYKIQYTTKPLPKIDLKCPVYGHDTLSTQCDHSK